MMNFQKALAIKSGSLLHKYLYIILKIIVSARSFFKIIILQIKNLKIRKQFTWEYAAQGQSQNAKPDQRDFKTNAF